MMDKVMDKMVDKVMERRKSRRSPMMNVLSVMGLVLFGAIAIPTVVGLISAIPDVMRYLRMRSM
jgi:hypothetical protein